MPQFKNEKLTQNAWPTPSIEFPQNNVSPKTLRLKDSVSWLHSTERSFTPTGATGNSTWTRIRYSKPKQTPHSLHPAFSCHRAPANQADRKLTSPSKITANIQSNFSGSILVVNNNFFAAIEPGQSHRQHTFVKHVWLIKNNDKPLGCFEAKFRESIVLDEKSFKNISSLETEHVATAETQNLGSRFVAIPPIKNSGSLRKTIICGSPVMTQNLKLQRMETQTILTR